MSSGLTLVAVVGLLRRHWQLSKTLTANFMRDEIRVQARRPAAVSSVTSAKSDMRKLAATMLASSDDDETDTNPEVIEALKTFCTQRRTTSSEGDRDED